MSAITGRITVPLKVRRTSAPLDPDVDGAEPKMTATVEPPAANEPFDGPTDSQASEASAVQSPFDKPMFVMTIDVWAPVVDRQTITGASITAVAVVGAAITCMGALTSLTGVSELSGNVVTLNANCPDIIPAVGVKR